MHTTKYPKYGPWNVYPSILVNDKPLPTFPSDSYDRDVNREALRTTYYAADGKEIEGAVSWSVRGSGTPLKDSSMKVNGPSGSRLKRLRYEIITMRWTEALGFELPFKDDDGAEGEEESKRPEILGLWIYWYNQWDSEEEEAVLRGNLESWQKLKDKWVVYSVSEEDGGTSFGPVVWRERWWEMYGRHFKGSRKGGEFVVEDV